MRVTGARTGEWTLRFYLASLLTHWRRDDLILQGGSSTNYSTSKKSIERNVHEIKAQNKTLAGLRENQRVHDKAFEEARKAQAQARSTVMQKEKKIKKAEKSLDAKVHVFHTRLIWPGGVNCSPLYLETRSRRHGRAT